MKNYFIINVRCKFNNLFGLITIMNLMILLLVGCEISGIQDEIIQKNYSYDTLRMLNIKNDIHVVLIQDSAEFIRIVAPEHMQDGLVPEIKGDTIILKNNNRSRFINRYSHEIKAEVHLASLKIIFYQGGGNITSSDTLKIQNLSIWSNGATGKVELIVKNNNLHLGLSTGNLDVTIFGETVDLTIWTTSYANIGLLNLKANNVNIRNNSPMDCYINVLKKLDAKVEYSGNIYYKGEPAEKEVSETSSGRVLSIN